MNNVEKLKQEAINKARARRESYQLSGKTNGAVRRAPFDQDRIRVSVEQMLVHLSIEKDFESLVEDNEGDEAAAKASVEGQELVMAMAQCWRDIKGPKGATPQGSSEYKYIWARIFSVFEPNDWFSGVFNEEAKMDFLAEWLDELKSASQAEAATPGYISKSIDEASGQSESGEHWLDHLKPDVTDRLHLRGPRDHDSLVSLPYSKAGDEAEEHGSEVAALFAASQEAHGTAIAEDYYWDGYQSE